MDSLSSSFLQNYSITPSLLTHSRPFLPLQFNTPIKAKAADSSSSPARTQLHTTEHTKTRQITPTKNHSNLLANLFKSVDGFICDFVDPPLVPAIDPKLVLSGNYAPVDELPPTVCQVEEGSLPPCLDGAYIRNGPNPQFIPRGPYHFFDGDGMLHCIRISRGKATFCSRFVKTYKYNVEREFGSPVVINYFAAFTSLPASVARCAVFFGRVLSGQYDIRRGTGNANTSLAHFGGKLFALCESDLPYAIKITSDGDIITLGRDEPFSVPLKSMTAHPKVDKETGEVFAFRPSVFRPYLTYFRINADGIKQTEVPILSMPEAAMTHDFLLRRLRYIS
ncbi:UNVERIFIED_CONTAM: putative carotenoid cleavage dioxygenase 4, chloroplastic [Sesamum latifolium]|uniref:Carotenoid cleavage dioxygenase 4, chloroplastic n=1 Tax=Sesamum latifolium TaxID=2727402 RepID=A0AAW2X1H9_9LAMI